MQVIQNHIFNSNIVNSHIPYYFTEEDLLPSDTFFIQIRDTFPNDDAYSITNDHYLKIGFTGYDNVFKIIESLSYINYRDSKYSYIGSILLVNFDEDLYLKLESVFKKYIRTLKIKKIKEAKE